MQQETEQMVALMAAMKLHGISDLSMETPKLKLSLKGAQGASVFEKPNTPTHNGPQTAIASPIVSDTPLSTPKEQTTLDSLTAVHSPLVGTYFQAGAPDIPPFVTQGQKVKQGDTLCIIEAMKSMNEIKSPHEGIIAEILCQNNQLVGFGQLLFRLNRGEPS